MGVRVVKAQSSTSTQLLSFIYGIVKFGVVVKSISGRGHRMKIEAAPTPRNSVLSNLQTLTLSKGTLQVLFIVFISFLLMGMKVLDNISASIVERVHVSKLIDSTEQR